LLVKTREHIGEPTGQKQVFKTSDIQRMSVDEFERYEKDIMIAQREGRVIQD